MKIADGFVLKTIADSYVVVPVGENLVDFSAMITINETGAFIWQQLEKNTDIDSVVEAMCSEFDIDPETARADCMEFVKILEDNKVVEK
ncbi:MAG: PqqD family protein [Clostridia bacterium]|nr:PqqD family protein [Clostridia bacterium]